MDFFADIIEQARQQLVVAGYAVAAPEMSEAICIKYFNVAKRRVRPQSRSVALSREFNCPVDLRAGFDELRRKAETGQDLRPNQSTRLADSDYDDSLLNDWGIQHFHLGTVIRPDGFAERTGPLLFARVTDDAVYCISILAHGAWSRQEMVAILHNNWPDTIARFRIRGIDPESLTDDDIRRLRKGNVNALVVMDDGTIYAPIGGGLMTSGKSAEVIRACDEVKWLCRKMEEAVSATATALGLQRQDFRLQVQNNRTVAVGQNGLAFDLGEALLFKSL